MFVTTLKCYPVKSASYVLHVSEGTAEETLAYLRGEEVTPSLFVHGFFVNEPVFSPFTIISTTRGTELNRYSAGTLRRTFQLFDDYLTEFPEASSIELPYSPDVIDEALSGLDYENRTTKLSGCIDCVKYLNPKSSTYFLRFLLQDTPIQQLIEISESLTKQDRIDILYARRRKEIDFPLPDEGVDYCILGAVLEKQNSMDTLKLLFPHSPSYWVAVACYRSNKILAIQLLIEQDFSQDIEWMQSESKSLNSIQQIILEGLSGVIDWETNWEGITHLLSMIGYHKKFSKNGQPIAAPFGAKRFHYTQTYLQNERTRKYVATFISPHSPTPLSVSQVMGMLG
jgi:hypothetical protein